MIISRDFRGAGETSRAVGITDRQRAYWARTGLVKPSGRPGRYSITDRLMLALVAELRRHQVSIQEVRSIIPEMLPALPRDITMVARLSLVLVKRIDSERYRWLVGDLVAVSGRWEGIRISFGDLLARLAEREGTASPALITHESRAVTVSPE